MEPDDQLRQHAEQLQHLIVLNANMAEAIHRMNAAITRIDRTLERLTANLEVITQLLHRAREDEQRNGGLHA